MLGVSSGSFGLRVAAGGLHTASPWLTRLPSASRHLPAPTPGDRENPGMECLPPLCHRTVSPLLSLKSSLALSCRTRRAEKAVRGGLCEAQKNCAKAGLTGKTRPLIPRAVGRLCVTARQAGGSQTGFTAWTGSPLILGVRRRTTRWILLCWPIFQPFYLH